MKSPTHVLVTGGAGFIGSHFSKLARSAGLLPVVYDNLSTGHRKFVKGPFVEGELSDTEKIVRTIQQYGIDQVVHFAAKALVGESVQKPQLYIENNLGGTRSLLKAMEKTAVSKLLFSSSCAIYGKAETPKISEDHPKNPTNPYGKSKLDCELEIFELQKKYSIKVGCLRYFNVIGQDPDGELYEDHTPETHIVPNIIKASNTRQAFKLFGTNFPTPDGTAVRDYIDVMDLGNVHLEALKFLSTQNLLISNVGNGRGYSNREVLAAAKKVFGHGPEVQECEARPGDPPSLVADNSFFKTWYKKPLKTVEQSLETMK